MLGIVALWGGGAFGVCSLCVLDLGMRPLTTDKIINFEINN
jgi:hypothetical protein